MATVTAVTDTGTVGTTGATTVIARPITIGAAITVTDPFTITLSAGGHPSPFLPSASPPRDDFP
jgi:hypothetical protein